METRNRIGNYTVTNRNRMRNNDIAMRRMLRRLTIYIIIIAVILTSILISSIIIHAKINDAEAEQNDSPNNSLSVTNSDKSTVHIKGSVNGVEYEYTDDGTILHGISIAGVDLGGMDYSKAREALLNDVEKRISNINIYMNVGSTTSLLTAADFNISCDVNPLIHKALQIGRNADQTDFYKVYLERQRIAAEGLNLGDYKLSMDEDNMRSIISDIANSVQQAPLEPYITLLNLVGGGKPGVGIGGRKDDIAAVTTVKAPDGTAIAEIQFHHGRKGYVLDEEDMLRKISEAFYAGNYNTEITLELKETEPASTAYDLANSVAEISRFSTSFASSNDSRSRNVQKAAELLHCIVMNPGQNYSYNELLGPREEKYGWLLAPGITGGKYVLTPGGGICQVSSTLYPALLQLGPDSIKIVKQQNHSIPPSYIALGLDATVSYGGPDLVWNNAVGKPLLLFTYADMNSKTVYAIIYGETSYDACTYKVWSELVAKIDPPASKVIEEPTWPSGYSQIETNPRTGYKGNIFRQKYDSQGNKVGETEKLGTYTYKADGGQVRMGTGDPNLPDPQG